jgi:hypothetical protein
LNGVTTTADISPASPSSGGTFNVTNYQNAVVLPQQLAEAAASQSNPLTGSATGQLDVTGATPATMPTGTLDFSVDIPENVPPSGLSFDVPSSPATIGPFTAGSGGNITIAEDSSITLTLEVGGSPLPLTCTAFPNNTPDFTSGWMGTGEPTSGSISPVIVVADPSGGSGSDPSGGSASDPSGGSGGSSDPSAVSASAGSLAFTGTGSVVGWIGVSGMILILCGFALLVLIDAPRRTLARFVAYRSSHSSSALPGEGAHEPKRLAGGLRRLRSWLLGE